MKRHPSPGVVLGTSAAEDVAARLPDLSIRRIGIALAAWEPQPDFFAEQLASIRAQVWQDWICIITCDSPLHGLRQERCLTPFFEDPRFVWIENGERLGHVRNFGKAIRECVRHGVDAIACSDQDDVWDEEKLAILAAALHGRGPMALVHSDMRCRGAEASDATTARLTVWQHERRHVDCVSPRQLMVRNVVSGCSMLFDAGLARHYPEIPPGIRYHDQWYAILAACHGGVHAVPRALMHYRQHAANVVGLRSSATAVQALCARGPRAWARAAVRQWRAHVLIGAALGRLGLGAHVTATDRAAWLAFLRCIWRDGAMRRNLCTLWVGACAFGILSAEDA